MTRVDVEKILASCDDRWASQLSDAIDWETLRAMALELREARNGYLCYVDACTERDMAMARIAELEAEHNAHWRADGRCHHEHEERKRYQAREIKLAEMRERISGLCDPTQTEAETELMREIEVILDEIDIPKRRAMR